MIAFERAVQRAAKAASPLAPRKTLLLQCRGLVLARPVVSPTDLLPFPSAMAGGFAVVSADLAGVSPLFPATLRVARSGRQPLRSGFATPVRAGEALPVGADAVVADAATRSSSEAHIVVVAPVELGELVHPAASEMRKGDPALEAGRRLGAPEIGLLASLGVASVSVHPAPRIGAAFIGNDRVLPGVQLGPGRSYDASAAIVSALAGSAGAATASLGELSEDPENLLQAVRRHARSLDLLVVSGGTDGPRPALLRDTVGWLEGEMLFDGVRVRPGGETLCARVGGCILFGLPSDTLGVLAAMRFFVRPAISRLMGHPAAGVRVEEARLAAPLRLAPSPRLDLVPGELRAGTTKDGGLAVAPGGATAMDCFILVPHGARAPRPGERVSIARIEPR